MKILHLSLTEWYFIIAACFIPINLVDQMVHFRRKEKEFAEPPTPTHPAKERARFKPAYRRLLVLTLLWPITVVFGYLGFMWDASPWTVANPRPWRY